MNIKRLVTLRTLNAIVTGTLLRRVPTSKSGLDFTKLLSKGVTSVASVRESATRDSDRRYTRQTLQR